MSTYTKENLIAKLTEQDDIASKAAAGRIVEAFLGDIKENVIAGNTVMIAGFVNLFPGVKAAGEARNPGTGEKVQVPEKKVVKVKITAPFKSAVENG